MRSVAASNETFNETFQAADTDDDGVPDENVTAVYDALFEAAPDEAGRVIYRSDDGSYAAVRMIVSVEGGASGDAITTQMRNVAGEIRGGDVTVTATGNAVLNKIVQDQLLETVVESLLITLVAVFAFLMLTYRVTEGSATLGAVTLLPVAFSVAWILGTMFLADIPFNVLTGMITSLTVGLGVAYSIHLSERYNQELERTGDVWTAMDRAVTGTGGALLGSAATTIGGFGVLVFAILPPLQQFGTITGMTIVYAFLAAVLVLPSLLVVWTRFLGPDWAADQIANGGDGRDDGPADAAATAANATGEVAVDAPSDAPIDDTVAGEVTAGAVVASNDDGRTADDATGGKAASVDADAEEFSEAGFVPATVVESDEVRAERQVSRTAAEPGESVTVTVTIRGVDGRFVLDERTGDAAVTISGSDPEPVSAVTAGNGPTVAWDAGGEASITYEIRLAGDATDGTRVPLSGTVVTRDGEHPVAGDDEIRIVADLFERVVAGETVTDADLALAERRFERGTLTEAQFEAIQRAWLGDGEADLGALVGPTAGEHADVTESSDDDRTEWRDDHGGSNAER
jgi:hypothetical protein